jgi:hypothetical protein
MRDLRRSRLAVDAAASAVCSLLDGGKLLLFDGQKPGDPDAPQNQQPIAELFFDAPAFSPAGVGTFNAGDVFPGLSVRRSGRPTWFRAVTSAGAPVFDGTVGKATFEPPAARYDLELDAEEVDLDSVVVVERMVYVEPQRRE